VLKVLDLPFQLDEAKVGGAPSMRTATRCPSTP